MSNFKLKHSVRYCIALTLVLPATGFDLIVQDTVFWPGALLAELLDVPIVEVLPLPIMTHKEPEMSFPNPLAYAPQMGLAYTDKMVSCCLLSAPYAWYTCHGLLMSIPSQAAGLGLGCMLTYNWC